jgi:hypothetical protein
VLPSSSLSFSAPEHSFDHSMSESHMLAWKGTNSALSHSLISPRQCTHLLSAQLAVGPKAFGEDADTSTYTRHSLEHGEREIVTFCVSYDVHDRQAIQASGALPARDTSVRPSCIATCRR